jgi:VanZ family protein
MSKRIISLIYYWTSTIAWAGLIYFFSAQPDLKITTSDWDLILRKLAHIFMFSIQTILVYRSLLWTVRTKVRQFELRKDYDASILITGLLLTIAILSTLLYAAFDEYHQTLVPSRVGAITDVLIDSIGIFISAGILFKVGIISEIEHRFARKGWAILTGQKYYGE